MRPGSCAPVAGAHVHAPVRVRLRHTSAVITVVDDLPVVATGRSGATGSGAAAVGGATGSGLGVGAAAAVSGTAGWGCGAGSSGTGDGAGGGAAPVDGSGAAFVDDGGVDVDAVRSRDGFELNKYHPPTSSRTSTASTAAIAGARDGSPMAGGALSVRGDSGTADDERSGKSSSDGGAARGRGGATAFGAAAFGAAGFGGAGGGGGAGRGGGADDAVGGGTDEALGAGADEAVGAGDKAAGGVSFKGMPRAVQNCSRFSRLVITNESLAGKLDVAIA